MKRAIGASIGLTLLFMAQTIMMPMWLPFGFVPDFLLLTIILVGFGKSGSQSFWLGLVLGSFQGWMQGKCWWAFAFSRSFAGAFSSWMRTRWLWQSPPAAGFCAAVSTISAETLLAVLLALSEHSLVPFALLLRIGTFEAVINAISGFAIMRIFRPKEARV